MTERRGGDIFVTENILFFRQKKELIFLGNDFPIISWSNMIPVIGKIGNNKYLRYTN